VIVIKKSKIRKFMNKKKERKAKREDLDTVSRDLEDSQNARKHKQTELVLQEKSA